MGQLFQTMGTSRRVGYTLVFSQLLDTNPTGMVGLGSVMESGDYWGPPYQRTKACSNYARGPVLYLVAPGYPPPTRAFGEPLGCSMVQLPPAIVEKPVSFTPPPMVHNEVDFAMSPTLPHPAPPPPYPIPGCSGNLGPAALCH
ncbi:hypothetical protein SKAU_G00064580 [Synaphobranchus kaupii]|uniref:Uncharacterized protein n=1 Tax=Synaphobranchus kaupii TaxID=118154 RepID=A0A9Q1G5I0_SYNKA|nr:hypothetical protein SKAU_G00064580 [Synaphobranchus kaupii]